MFMTTICSIKGIKTTKSNIEDTPSRIGGRMTLPKMPLKEWLSSSSSPQNVDQRDGKCRLLLSSPFSSRKRAAKSPPSSDPEDGEKWLQEARALPLQNALQTLIKTLFGSSCGLACGRHTGHKSPEIRFRRYNTFRRLSNIPTPKCLLVPKQTNMENTGKMING